MVILLDTIVVWTRKKTRQTATLLVCWFFASCTPAVTVPLTPDQTHAPLDTRWEKLSGGQQMSSAVRAVADIDMVTSVGRQHLRAAVLLQPPFMMRMESIPVFGPPDFFLSLNRDKLKIFLPGKKDFYQGRPSRENLSHFLPISLPPTDMVYVLLGLPPPPYFTGAKIGYRESRDSGKKRLDIFSNNHIIRRLWSDEKVERLTDMEIIDIDKELAYRVSYGKYLRAEESNLPQQVTIVSKDGDAKIIVHYDDMELFTSVDDDTFDLPIPMGITPTSLDRDETPWN